MLKYTIAVEGWDQLRAIAPIAEYVNMVAHSRDEGEIDDIGVVCALDAAAYALMMLLGQIAFGLSEVPKNEVTLDDAAWNYLPAQMAEIIQLIKEIGPSRIRGEDGTLEEPKP
jgi:hypothetical protein